MINPKDWRPQFKNSLEEAFGFLVENISARYENITDEELETFTKSLTDKEISKFLPVVSEDENSEGEDDLVSKET